MRLTVAALSAFVILAAPLHAQGERISDLTTRVGDVPRRVIGYGIVVGLDGTGDRSFGSANGASQTVRSVANALRRFGVEVPPERLRPRNVAAVIVTAEMSPYLHAGGRFEVQVSSLGDATSLRGGVLWTTPLVTDVDQPPVATAQGPMLISDDNFRVQGRNGNSARIPEGGVLEVEPPAIAALTPKLLLRRPDLTTASRIADAVNVVYGNGVAKVEDPGSVVLNPGAKVADNLLGFLASVDTIQVRANEPARIVIDARNGSVVVGGDVRVGTAAVSQRGITLRIGAVAAGGAAGTAPDSLNPGLLHLPEGASVQDVAAGLHAAGARPSEIASLFDALREVGALSARVTIR
ncbi:MAG: flagellar basal body P-ring protein FlgI [Gemmatimonadota bacterium]